MVYAPVESVTALLAALMLSPGQTATTAPAIGVCRTRSMTTPFTVFGNPHGIRSTWQKLMSVEVEDDACEPDGERPDGESGQADKKTPTPMRHTAARLRANRFDEKSIGAALVQRMSQRLLWIFLVREQLSRARDAWRDSRSVARRPQEQAIHAAFNSSRRSPIRTQRAGTSEGLCGRRLWEMRDCE